MSGRAPPTPTATATATATATTASGKQLPFPTASASPCTLPAPPSEFPAAAPGVLSRWNAALPAPLSSHTLVFIGAGAMARASSATLTSPLDTVKVRLQFSRRGASAGVQAYGSAREAAAVMWQREGVPAFFRGLPARLMYVVPAAACSFVLYEQFRAMYHASPAQRANRSGWSVLVPLLAAGGARVIGTAIRTPFDIIRQRMQIRGGLPSAEEQLRLPVHQRTLGVYSSSAEALRRVRAVEGVRALWVGLGATILRDVPFAVVYFFAYEHSKTLQARWMGREAEEGANSLQLDATTPALTLRTSSPMAADACERRAAGLSTPRYMLSGAFAAACAVTLTMPLDVIKTRLQTQGSLPEYLRYRGVWDCARSVAKGEGARGFFRGLLPRICYLSPSAALTFSLYELYKRQLERAFHIHSYA